MTFSIADILLFALGAGFILTGLYQGFIRTLGSLVGLVGGMALGAYGIIWLSQFVDLTDHPVWKVLIFILIVIISGQLIGWVFELADRAWKILSIIPFLTSINKLLGGLLGLVEALLILAAIGYYTRTYAPEGSVSEAILTSTVIGWVDWVSGFIVWLFPQITTAV